MTASVSTNNNLDLLTIVLIAAGALAVLAIIVAVIICCVVRRRAAAAAAAASNAADVPLDTRVPLRLGTISGEDYELPSEPLGDGTASENTEYARVSARSGALYDRVSLAGDRSNNKQ